MLPYAVVLVPRHGATRTGYNNGWLPRADRLCAARARGAGPLLNIHPVPLRPSSGGVREEEDSPTARWGTPVQHLALHPIEVRRFCFGTRYHPPRFCV